jgi:CBS domain-containing protein
MLTEVDYREIGNVMSKDVFTVSEEDNVLQVAKQMASRQFSCIVVTRMKKPMGILTERDLIQRVIVKGIDAKKTKVKDIMSSPVVSVPPEADLVPTGELMKKKKVRRFPVTDDKGKLIGLVTESDILQGIIKLVKHLDWKLVTMKISVEEYIDKLKESRIL